MLQAVEERLVRPKQVLTTILALLPESRGGDRAARILPLLVKVEIQGHCRGRLVRCPGAALG